MALSFWSRVALGALAAGTLVIGASQGKLSRSESAGVAAALLADGRIIVVDTVSGRLLADHPPMLAAPWQSLPGHLFARSASGNEVFALILGPGKSSIAALDMRTLALRTVRLLGGNHVSLAVGQRTGALFVFDATGVDVAVLDPTTGGDRMRLTPENNGLRVYSGSISADERRVYVSYHTPGTGIDWFTLTGQVWRRCATSDGPAKRCILSHGGFAVLPGRLLAATGGSTVLELDAEGNRLRGIDTGLAGNHLMEFAVDEERRRIYAVGSCFSSGGFTATPWPVSGATSARYFTEPGDYSICGDRLALSPDGRTLVVASGSIPSGAPIPIAPRPGMLLVVDTRTGSIVRHIETSSDPVDIIVLR